MEQYAVVFMLHRFQMPEFEIEGHNPEEVRGVLEYLRRHKYQVISVTELLTRLARDDVPLRGAVAFTMDDGYLDQASVAGPLFAEFDFPVTTFVVTGFLSRQLWLWWDQIEYVFRNTHRREVTTSIGNIELKYAWIDNVERESAQTHFLEQCKKAPSGDRYAAIRQFAAEAEVEIPARPPPQYAAMSWDQVRSSEKSGMTFGPHTVSHPILAQLSDAETHAEIVSSWETLSVEARRPVPVFAYPNGREEDFGQREIGVLEQLEFIGAFSAVPGYATNISANAQQKPQYHVPRFSYPNDLPHVVQCVAGLERVKQILRLAKA